MGADPRRRSRQPGDKVDLSATATRFEVPVVFIQGKDDLLTTTSVVRDYSSRIAASNKCFIELPAAGHNALFGNREQFLQQLVQHVRPLAGKAGD